MIHEIMDMYKFIYFSYFFIQILNYIIRNNLSEYPRYDLRIIVKEYIIFLRIYNILSLIYNIYLEYKMY